MNGTHFAHPKCAITAHQIDHLWKMLESYPREIEISNAMIPTACFKCEISSKRNKSSSWRIFSNFTFFPTIQTTQIQYRSFLETVKWWIKCQAGQDQEVFLSLSVLAAAWSLLENYSNNSCNIYDTKILQFSHFLSVLSFDLGRFLK